MNEQATPSDNGARGRRPAPDNGARGRRPAPDNGARGRRPAPDNGARRRRPAPAPVIIVAATEDGAIGLRGDMLYHLRDDLRRFRALTMGHAIIMGRRTFESFPKGALPGRRNIVLTRNADYTAEGIETAPTLEAALQMCADDPSPYIIGGESVYRQALPLAAAVELTLIHATAAEADTYFPLADVRTWPVTARQEHPSADPATPSYTFLTLIRP